MGGVGTSSSPHSFLPLILLILLLSLSVEVGSEFLTGRATYSSLPLYSARSVPDLAVDSLRYEPSRPADETCFMSGRTTQGGETCWFAVDLERLYRLVSLTIHLSYFSSIHERLNAYGNLVNVSIGVTNSSPVATTPRLGGPKACGGYQKPIYNSTTALSIYCYSNLPPSRYVVVQQAEGIGGYLTLCELEVRLTEVVVPMETTTAQPVVSTREMDPGTIGRPMFRRGRGNNMPSGLSRLPSYRHIRVRSDLECVAKCLERFKDWCTSSDYRSGNENCEIAGSTEEALGGNVTYGEDWLLARITVY